MTESNLTRSDHSVIHVQIITLGLLHTAEMGSLYFVAPAYKSALADIKLIYPRLRVTQDLVTDPAFKLCSDLMLESDNLLARFYYSNKQTWRKANFTVFVSNEADCDGHGSAYLAGNLGKLSISTSTTMDLANKAKWPTRIEAGQVSASSTVTYARVLLEILRHFSWTTVIIICEGVRNPAFCQGAQTIKKEISRLSKIAVTVISIDGFSPTTNFTSLLLELGKRTRSIVPEETWEAGKRSVQDRHVKSRTHSACNSEDVRHFRYGSFFHQMLFGQTVRKLMIAAGRLNMTRGEHVFVVYRALRNPILGSYDWKYGDEYDEEAKKAFSAVFVLERNSDSEFPPPGSDLYLLIENWRQASYTEYNVTIPRTTENSHPSTAYSMLMMVAEVIDEYCNRTVSSCVDDGRELARMFHNRTFVLRTGTYTFDQHGSLNSANYQLAQYRGNELTKNMLIVNASSPTVLQLEPVSWPAGAVWPVSSTPRCGFDGLGSLCQDKTTWRTSWAVGGTLVILFGLSFVFWKLRFSPDANDAAWWNLTPLYIEFT